MAIITPILKVSQFSTEIPFPKEIKQKGYSFRPTEILQGVNNNMYMKGILRIDLSLYLEHETPIYVKVRSHKRLYNGRIVKVRSYYRRVLGCKGIEKRTQR